MSALSILYYNRALLSPEGPAIHAKELLHALRELGVEVCCYPEPQSARNNDGYLKKSPFRRRGGLVKESLKEAFRVLRGAVNSIVDACRLVRILRTRRADVILTRSFEYNVAPLIARRITGVPVICEVNALLYMERRRSRHNLFLMLLRMLEKRVIERSDAIYVVSDELLGVLETEGISPRRSFVVPNGVNGSVFHPGVAPKRDEIPIVKEDTIVIGFTGSLHPWHGVDVLLEAFDLVRQKAQNVALIVVGDGVEMAFLRGIVEDRKMGDWVWFTGSVNHSCIPAYVSGFDIAVAPYREKNPFYFSPLKVYEYMAMGKPVVASSLGQLRDLFGDREAGILVDADDPKALAEGLLMLVGDRGKRLALGEGGRRRAVEGHLWTHTSEAVVDICQKVSR